MSSSKKSKAQYGREYKDRIVQEYLRGETSAKEIAEREKIERGQIYNWKIQFTERDRNTKIVDIADSTGLSIDQARQIQELQEELEATQKKVSQLLLENDLLKKIQPNSPFERKSSGYIETKKMLARSKGRVK
jgi:transposase